MSPSLGYAGQPHPTYDINKWIVVDCCCYLVQIFTAISEQVRTGHNEEYGLEDLFYQYGMELDVLNTGEQV